MTLPRAPGFQNAKASGFIPEIYANQWNFRFYANTIASTITNTRFQGLIQKQGDKIIIPTVPTIEWTKYHKGQKLEITGKLESDPITMEINRGQYFKFVQDDVDQAQSYVDAVKAALENSARQGATRIDHEILCDLPFHVSPCNQGCNAGAMSNGYNLGGLMATGCGPVELVCGSDLCSNDAINLLLDMISVLEEQNVIGGDPSNPTGGGEGFWFVIPPFFKNLILKHPRFQNADAMGDKQSVLRNGKIGMIDGAEVLSSNLLPFYDESDGKGGVRRVWQILAGHKMATTFASQLTRKDYGMRSEQTFGDIYRQLQVYDWKVTNPEALVLARVTKG